MNAELIEIRDIGALTVLKINNIQPAHKRIQNVNGKKRLVFLFHAHELGSLVSDYFDHKIQVDAREFAGVLKKVKQEIYNLKIDLSGGENGETEEG